MNDDFCLGGLVGFGLMFILHFVVKRDWWKTLAMIGDAGGSEKFPNGIWYRITREDAAEPEKP